MNTVSETQASRLVPPDADEESARLITAGLCPIRVPSEADRHRDVHCLEPNEDGMPVCKTHGPEFRAHAAEEYTRLTEQLPRLEKEASQARGRVSRADDRLDLARRTVEWYRAAGLADG